jgi:transposase
MRVVPIKPLEHPDLHALQRVRERLIKARTAFVNAIRGLLREYGIVLALSTYELVASFGDAEAAPMAQGVGQPR